ncbi:hypothetical protein [Sediminicoccus sp. KRV36]|uniref:hypothetical protein n=1 Tax=Sediminicoccus sp. KRV36 TaxID=3133721 RepID=UPI00200D620F|nr:hypothetical protein [Sediminicoccus rosea]UPY39133.1 hypothetical protein LHU95_10695 [Sediminicoccus rosea]
MKRFFSLAPWALALCLALPGLARAQAPAPAQDCVAAGLLAVDSVSYGTQRVPRDPNQRGGSEWVTLSVGLRNISTTPVSFTASFSARPVMQDFLAGQRWSLTAGSRTTIIVANMLSPGMPESSVRQLLRLNCA